jgi:hypothetical protein
MKRSLLAFIVALAIAGTASAQAAAPSTAPSAKPGAQAQLITVSGKLELINGIIGLKADGTTYYAPRLRQLVGFVKELQEGAAVKLEGYSYPIPNSAGFSMLAVTKVSVAGKDYDLSQNGGFGGMGMRGGRGGMHGGMWGGGMWGGGMWGGPRR